MNFWEDYNSRPDVNYAENPAGPSYKKQQPQKKKKKNFWTDQISTAGGILGGIGGSFVAPIAGTAGGAAAGSALGEAIEKLIAPKTTDWGDVVQEGVLGGVLGAGPIKLAKGGVALATGKGIQGASMAAQTPLRQALGGKLAGSADDLAVKQFRLTPTQLNNFNKKFKEDAGTTIRKYGFHSVDDIQTKGIAPLQDEFDAAITSIPGLTKQSLTETFGKRINKLTTAGPSDTQAIGKQLKREFDTIIKGKGDVLDANDVNALRRQFDDLVNYTDKVANPTRYGVNKHMADGLREALQKADPTGNLKNTGRELQKLRQLAENAGRQDQLGRGSLPLGLGNLMGGIAGGTAAGGPMGAAGGIMATQVLNSGGGRRAAMNIADKAGRGLTSAGTKAAGQSRKGIAKRVGAGGLVTGYMDQMSQEPQSLEDALSQSLSNNMDSTMADATSTNPTTNASMMGGLYPDGQESSSPYTKANLLADLQRDPENAKDYIAYYSQLDEIFNPQGAAQKPLSTEAAKSVSNAETGIAALGDFEGAINRDPSVLAKRNIPGRGLLGGVLGGALGTRGADAAANQIVDVIARLRTGAAITADEAKRFEQFIPTSGDPQNVRQQKLNYLRNQFNMVANRASQGGGGLEDALMQYQRGY